MCSESTLRIYSASELIAFSSQVNGGLDYSGTTVYLDSDIEFTEELSQQFKPIGDGTNYFLGTFNGHGHVIRNLTVKENLEKVGLFGYSNGATIKNVVMDSSCSVSSTFTEKESAFVGGVIGQCTAGSAQCIIENNVNMAGVSFNGDVGSNHALIGGIVGIIKPSSLTATVVNCVNYGAITSTGNAGNSQNIGGIIGECYGNYVYNCLNYGTISVAKSSTYIQVGGIIGKSWSNTIENCVNAGRIIPFDSRESTGNIVGYIIGYTEGFTASSPAAIQHCYWTEDTGCGKGHYTDDPGSVTSTDASVVPVDKATVDELNNYAGAMGGTSGSSTQTTRRRHSGQATTATTTGSPLHPS